MESLFVMDFFAISLSEFSRRLTAADVPIVVK